VLNKFRIIKEPIWLIEASYAIADSYAGRKGYDSKEIEKYWTSEEEMKKYLHNFDKFKSNVLMDLIPILNNEFAELVQYFENNSLGKPIAVIFVENYFKIKRKGKRTISDKLINEVIFEMLDGIMERFSNDDVKNYNTDNIADVITMLNKSALENEMKMLLVSFCSDRYYLARKIIGMLEIFIPSLKKYFGIIEKDYFNTVNKLKAEDNIITKCDTEMGLHLPNNLDMDIYVNIFYYNQLVVKMTDDRINLFIGMYLFELCELERKNKISNAKIVGDIKALGDLTRYKILYLLSEKSMYIQQISNELGITPAAVSHHISILIQANLIVTSISDQRAKKVYYEVNREKIIELSQNIKELAK